MLLRRYIVLILFVLLGCSAVHAQLVFVPDVWNFGTIAETDGRVSHTFTGENRSDKPIVLLEVITTCGCTMPEFSKRPIRPGEKTSIKVTFDPTNRPGSFSKSLSIYSSERRKIATLTIEGNVTPRPKTVEELYPVDAGGGLRLGTTLCAFSYIREGQQSQSAVGYTNTSKRPIRIELRSKEASGLLTVKYEPEIAPGETGEINLVYHIPEGTPYYGTISDALEVRVNGRSNGTLLVAHGIGIDKPIAGNGPSPKMLITENIIKFGAVKHKATKQNHAITLSNSGNSELIVRAVETGGKITTTLVPGARIPAGGSLAADVVLNPGQQEYGVMTDYVTVITNDPARPMRRVRVTAIIED
ncbi:DUF1573 domain-containing protein [uncultured Alistipes sp.]|jgi:hypothetical protein|uniref:DUF1573 domain-containing protein n=1 Tax=uncultured Alistipes sp. TaxID=538949 RepID=UPI0025F2037F|nr:DUF1573 domain-containing protein [uncultured Alistipes sp.]